MKRFQSHISLFLLCLFAFPQVNNALHYFVVEHHFHNNTNEKQFNHNHQNHNCEQSIFKIPNILLFDFGYTQQVKAIVFNKKSILISISLYKKNVFNSLSNRGPPFEFKS